VSFNDFKSWFGENDETKKDEDILLLFNQMDPIHHQSVPLIKLDKFLLMIAEKYPDYPHFTKERINVRDILQPDGDTATPSKGDTATPSKGGGINNRKKKRKSKKKKSKKKSRYHKRNKKHKKSKRK